MEFKTFNDLPEMPEDKALKDEGERPILEEVRTMRKHVIPKYPMFIGRDRKASISVSSSAVSRRHAKVYEENGIFYVQDLGSINGTYVNGKRILDPVPLKQGDRIKISVTKEYKHGVKEFEFKHDLTEQQNLEEGRKMLLEDVHIFADEGTNKTIFIKDCLCYVTKKDLVSVLKSENPRRVPLEQFDLKKANIRFLSLCPYKAKDLLMLSLEHPNLSTAIKMQIKVNSVEQREEHGIAAHQCEIVKISDEDREKFKEKIELSPFICYVNSTLQKTT